MGLTVTCALLLGCSKPPPPKPPPKPAAPVELAPAEETLPDEPAPPEPMETGSDCATATVLCEDGVCTATVKNACKTPVTCELRVVSGCRMTGSRTGEARNTGKGTVLPGESGDVEAWGDCEGGTLVFTEPVDMQCG